MAGIAAAGYAFCIAIAVAVVWMIARRHRPAGAFPPAVQALLAAARRRALIAVVFSAAMFVAAVIAGFAMRDLMGLPLLLAASLAGSAGLLLYSATPPHATPISPGERREVSLARRTPWTFVARPAALIPLALVVLQVAFLMFAGITSSPDEAGRYRLIAFQTETSAAAASPYAGWFYGIPLLVSTTILLLSTAFAFWRVSSTPALPQSEFVAVDAGWRRATTRILAGVSVSALLVQLGGSSLISGVSMQNAYVDGIPPIWAIVAGVLSIGGAVMLVGSVVSLTLAALWALSLQEFATRSTPQATTAVALESGEVA